jgi:hypothetical protein
MRSPRASRQAATDTRRASAAWSAPTGASSAISAVSRSANASPPAASPRSCHHRPRPRDGRVHLGDRRSGATTTGRLNRPSARRSHALPPRRRHRRRRVAVGHPPSSYEPIRDRRSPLERGSPETKPRSCGPEPALESLLNRRLDARLPPWPLASLTACSQPQGADLSCKNSCTWIRRSASSAKLVNTNSVIDLLGAERAGDRVAPHGGA